MKKRIISYKEYGIMVNKLTKQIESAELYSNIKYVYGPRRGGLPISVHLSHYLNLEFLDDDLFQNMVTDNQRNKTLIVDDITDTGVTLDCIKDNYNFNFINATLFYKPRSIIKPDFYIEKTTDWIYFPWEKSDEKPNRPEYV